MRSALLCLLALTGDALAQPPAAEDGKPAPVTYTFGADAHAGFGEIMEAHVAARLELGIAPRHALVVRAGVGTASWWESEIDDPTYRELLARVGYRISSRRLFAGAELGTSWFKAHYPPEEQMGRDPHWFSDLTVTGLAGVRIGPVRLSLDYTYDLTSPVRQIGVQLGVDAVSL